MVRIALVAELSVTSDTSFEEAIAGAVDGATTRFGQVLSVWVKEQRVNVQAGGISEFQVNLLVTYLPPETKTAGLGVDEGVRVM